MPSSNPISPFMEGSGSDRDEEGKGSLILSSAGGSSARQVCFEAPIKLFKETLDRLWLTILCPEFGVSLWYESGVSAPSPLSNQLDSDEERSRSLL